MAVVTITPPGLLAEQALVKQHLRVDSSEEDALIELYVAAASGHIDGVGAYLGRAIGEQTLEWDVAAFSDIPHQCTLADPQPLPYGPAKSIVSIKFEDESGDDQTLAADLYGLAGGRLVFVDATLPVGQKVRIRYVVGGDAPKPIVAAVLLMVGDLYARRESDSSSSGEVPMSRTVENLLRPFRDLSV